jgi:hypothetical protein
LGYPPAGKRDGISRALPAHALLRQEEATMKASIAFLLVMLVLRSHAFAAGEPWVLSANNWQQAQELLPAPILDRVKRGDYIFKVVPVDPVKFRANYSRRFWEASAANQGKYDLAPNVCGLADPATGKMPAFFFGYPFPRIDPADPRAGCKIAWNFAAATMQGEGGGGTFSISGITQDGEQRRIKLSGEVMSYLGRHGGPVDNPENMRGKAIVFVIEPADIADVSFLVHQKNDWHSEDLVWGYLPQNRRVRRLSPSTRSDPIAGIDMFPDDANCYAGKIEYMKWTLKGRGKILAPVTGVSAFPLRSLTPTRFAVDIPTTRAVYETPGAKGVPWQIVDGLVYVPRDVWIVEGESTDPQYNFARVVFYVDAEMYQIHWKLVYSRAGEYFYNAACSHHWAKSADDTYSAVANDLVIGVNDKTNTAAFGGRMTTHFLERQFVPDRFTLPALLRGRSD